LLKNLRFSLFLHFFILLKTNYIPFCLNREPLVLFEYVTILTAITVAAVLFSLFFKLNDAKMRYFLVISAGIIFGISIFHFVPELYRHFTIMGLVCVILGFSIPYIISHVSDNLSKHHENFSFIDSITFISFSIDAIIDGLILGSAIKENSQYLLIGLILHRIPMTFSLVSILRTHTKSASIMYLLCFTFIALTPLSALIGNYYISAFTLNTTQYFTYLTSGIFIYISVYHILYEHQLYTKPNLKYLALGIFIALFTSIFHLG
jgi:zinc transporter ZupT